MIDQAVLAYMESFKSQSSEITTYAMHLAGILAVISIALSLMFTFMQTQDLNSLFAKLIQMVFVIGFFFGMITLCTSWIPDLLSSLMQIGAKTSGLTSLSPDGIAGQGYYLFVKILKAAWDVGILHAATAIIAIIVAFILLLIYALIAAELALILVKCYAMIMIGPLVFSLGVLEITRPTVMNYFNKILGLGLQLLTMYLILGVGIKQSLHFVDLIKQSTQSTFDLTPLGQIFIGLIIFYIIVKEVPPFVGQISGATGLRNYSDQAVTGATTAGAMTATAIQSAGGGTSSLIRGGANAFQAGKSTGMGSAGMSNLSNSTEAFKAGNFMQAAGSGAKGGAQMLAAAGGKSIGAAAKTMLSAAGKATGVSGKNSGSDTSDAFK